MGNRGSRKRKALSVAEKKDESDGDQRNPPFYQDGVVLLEDACLDDCQELALGCRPKHEFLFRKSMTRDLRWVSEYACTSAECRVRRYIVGAPKANKSAKGAKFTVFESDKHRDSHKPLARKQYPYNRAQKEFMESEYTRDGSVTASALYDAMEDKGLLRGITVRMLGGWLKRRRKADPGRNPLPQYLADVKSAVQRFKRESDWAAKDPERQLLLPLPPEQDYVITGKDVKGEKAPTTRDGTKFNFVVPMSTPAMLRRLVEGREQHFKQLDERSFLDVLRKGFTVKRVDSCGFAGIDGILKCIRGASILVLEVPTKNGHSRRCAYAVASGETSDHVELFLQSVHLAVKRLFKGEDGRFLWLMGDMGPGIVKGAQGYADWMYERARWTQMRKSRRPTASPTS